MATPGPDTFPSSLAVVNAIPNYHQDRLVGSMVGCYLVAVALFTGAILLDGWRNFP